LPDDERPKRLSLRWGNLGELPAEICELTWLQELDLGGNYLTSLPKALSLLEHLEVLRLALNDFTTVPDELGELRNLRVLDLSYNELRDCPALVARLPALEELNLNHNVLGKFPVVGDLGNLRRLSLSSVALREIPVDLQSLGELEYLDIGNGTPLPADPGGHRVFPVRADPVEDPRLARGWDNVLPSLPSSVKDLVGLTELRCFGVSLEALPPEIAWLGELEVLELGGNALTELPAEIGSLASLTDLGLTDNALVTLPQELGQLDQLATLSARGNRLEQLPEFVGDLVNLAVLDVGENRLVSIAPVSALEALTELEIDQNRIETLPSAIDQLTELSIVRANGNLLRCLPDAVGRVQSLSVLDLRDNELTQLPGSLADLSPELDLRVEGNPLVDPLPLLLRSGVPDLFTYLRSLDEAVPQYEAKLLLVGEGKVGKSSLIAALRGEVFVADRPTTHGIELKPLELRHPSDDVSLLLNVWDFGGQEIYRITHQFFFSRRALYVVVWNPREGQEAGAVEEWCRRIRLRIGSDARVVIVATHADERRADLDYDGLRERSGGLVVASHAVDSRSGTGIEDLRRALAVHAAALPQMGELLNPRWRAAREDALSRDQPQITYAQFEDLSRGHGLSADDTEALVKLLHELGHVIYYSDDEGLQDVVVLNPEWLTKAISYVLEDRDIAAHGGLAEHARLREIWSTRGPEYPARYHPYFLRLMEKFDVSYRVPDGTASLIAQLVPFAHPRIPWQTGRTRELSLVCELDEPADGLIAWLTVRHHRFSTGAHWRRGVFLEHRDYRSQAVMELDKDTHLGVKVVGPSPEAFFTILRDGIEHLIRQRWKGLGYRILVPCNGRLDDGKPCPEQFKYHQLERARERGRAIWECPECATEHDLTKLLTGFESAPAGTTAAQLERLSDQLTEVQAEVHDVVSTTAQIGYGVRQVLRAVTAEITDCPRLFHLTRQQRSLPTPRALISDAYRLTLWCEHSDHEHPILGQTYSLEIAKERLAAVLPYAALVVRILRSVLPVAGAIVDASFANEDRNGVTADIDLMKALVDSVRLANMESDRAFPGTGLSRLEGQGLRAFRALLFETDPSKGFAGLQRRQAASGDFVWICPEHYRSYDPGLPEFPGVAAAPM
jgi:Leucine-rich repeat (LRR) protein